MIWLLVLETARKRSEGQREVVDGQVEAAKVILSRKDVADGVGFGVYWMKAK